jgi:hypothetical protein
VTTFLQELGCDISHSMAALAATPLLNGVMGMTLMRAIRIDATLLHQNAGRKEG